MPIKKPLQPQPSTGIPAGVFFIKEGLILLEKEEK